MSPAEELAKKLSGSKSPTKEPKRVVVWPKSKLTKKRVSLGISARVVADALGMKTQSLMHIESGVGVNLLTAYKLAKFYGCSIEELFGEPEEAK